MIAAAFRRLPLPWKLTLVPGLLALVLMALLLWTGEHLFEQRLRKAAALEAEQSARLLASRVVRYVDRRFRELRVIGGLPELQAPDAGPKRREVLERALRFSPAFVWLGVRSASGEFIGSTGEPPSLLLGNVADGGAAVRIGRVVVDPPFSAALGQPADLAYLDVAVAAEGSRLQVVGRIAWHNLVQLRDDQRDDQPEGGLQRLLLVAGDAFAIDDLVPAAWRPTLLAQAAAMPRAAAWPQVPDGPQLLVAVAGVPLEPLSSWRVLAAQDLDGIVAPALVLKHNLAIASIFAALLFGSAGYLVSRRLARPYRPFLEAIALRVVERPGEARTVLTRHLDAITAELDASPQVTTLRQPATDVLGRLVESAQSLQAVLEQVPVGVLLLGRDGMLLFASRAAERLLRLDLVDRRRPLVDGFADPEARTAVMQTLATGDGRTAELRLNDGSSPWRHLRAAPLTDRIGTPLGVLLVVQDVSAELLAERRAAALEAHLRILVDAAEDTAFMRLDRDGRVTQPGPMAGRLDGYDAAELDGRSFASFFDEDDRDAQLPERLLEEARDRGRAEHAGWRPRRDGGRYWAELALYPLPEDGGHALLIRDLTAHRQAERRLAESQARLAALVASANDGIISVDGARRVTLYNPAAERIFGVAAEAVVGRTLPPPIPAQLIAGGRMQAQRADGSRVELEASISEADAGGAQVTTAIVRDITARVRAEEALLRYQQELHSLTQQLMTQEKVTTARLAQALHDQLGQTLAALRLTLDAIAPAGAPDGRDAVGRARDLAAQAVREVRHVLIDLRPPLLDEQGLVPALENEVALQSERHADIDLLFDQALADPLRRWPADVEYAAFMVAREALANALQHARASVVRTTVSAELDDLRIEVEDDGQGSVAAGPGVRFFRPGHFGVVGMRERAAAVGARFTIEERRDAGVLVRFEWTAARPPAEPRRTAAALTADEDR